MAFDLTVNAGNILTVIGFLGGGWVFVWAMRTRIETLTMEIKVLKDSADVQNQQLMEFAKALVDLARQEERLNALDRRVEDMRYGRGFVIAREFDTQGGKG